MTAPTPIRTTAEPRRPEVIAVEMEQLTDAVRVVMTEYANSVAFYAGRPVRAPVSVMRPVSLKEASRRTGWAARRIREHIMRRANRPDLPQLGFQPGDVASSPWHVYLDVLDAYIAGQSRSR
jgi:hypothetical protein